MRCANQVTVLPYAPPPPRPLYVGRTCGPYLLLHALLSAVELQEEGGQFCIAQATVAVTGTHHHLIQEFCGGRRLRNRRVPSQPGLPKTGSRFLNCTVWVVLDLRQ